MSSSSKILLTGATGVVGQYIAGHFGRFVQLLTPARHEMDITNANQVRAYIENYTPDIIIHSAAFTDNTAAEKDRGNKKGACWKVNVEGTKNIVEAAKKCSAYIINISTGSVFSGDGNTPGPFKEDDIVSPDGKLSWYGVTKKESEKLIPGAIIRLSHPVSRPEIFYIPPQDTVEEFRPRQDYVAQMLSRFDNHTLFPLFTDQLFTLTYLDDVVIAIKNLIETREAGIFHVVSYDMVSPHELMKYAIFKARHVDPILAQTTFDEFIKTQEYPLRFSKYSAIDGSRTVKALSLPVRTWREIVDCLYEVRNV
jgi:dTDP-4-dehydrorhamnose reductase